MKSRILLTLTTLLFVTYSCKTNNSEQLVEKAEIRQWKPEDTRTIAGASVERGLIKKTDQATQGYVLFSPSNSTQSYLMDMDGNIVHVWNGELSTLLHGYLLENGHLIRLERDIDFPIFAAGGQAGRIREYDWDGNMVWDFEYANENELTHHDIEVLPNGNILAISYEVKTPEEAIEAGRDPHNIAKAGIWPDKIIEIKPTKPSGGEIVWEWHMWDHLIQDIDSTKQNYGVIANNPQKININAHSGEGPPPMTEEQIEGMKKTGFATSNATVDNQTSDISHVNSIGYNAELDQIVISIPHFGEIYIIDHNTTTEEAKGSAGDLLYRWGNPGNYGRGTKEDQKLFGQHDVKWIRKGYPGAGNLIVFNNDIVNPNNKLPSVWAAIMAAKSPDPQVSVGDLGNHSSVLELTPPLNEDGNYMLADGGTYGPTEATWSYTAPDKYSLYSAFVSGAQRLKNGNTLITSGAKGRFIEVTPENDIVWEYWNPYNQNYKLPDGSPPQPTGPFIYAQFRSTHFTADYPAFKGKELKAIESQPEPFIFKMPSSPVKDSIQ